MKSAVTNSIRSSAIQGVILKAIWGFFPLMFIISSRLHSIRIRNFLATDLNLMAKFSNVEQREHHVLT